MSKLVSVSHSRLDSLSRCGIKFAFRYLDHKRTPPNAPMLIGRVVDEAVGSNLQRKIDDGKLMSLEEVSDTARDAAEAAMMNGLDMTQEEETEKKVRDRITDSAVRLTVLHGKLVAPGLRPRKVQRGFEIDLSPRVRALWRGYIDVTEESGTIRDLKATKKSPEKGAADRSQQLTVYAMASYALDGKMPEKVVFDFLINLKSGPKYREQVSERSREDFLPILRRADQFVKIVEAGAFTPAPPDSWWCSEKWCEYWHECPYASRPVSLATQNGG